MSSFPIDLSGDFYTDKNSREIGSISLFGSRSGFGTNFLEVTPFNVFNGLVDSRNFRMIVGVPDRFPVNEDIPAPTGLTQSGNTFSSNDTTGSYYATFFDGVDFGYDTSLGTTHSAPIVDPTDTIRARFTTEANDGGDRGPWSEVFTFSNGVVTGTTPLPEAPTIVFPSLAVPYSFADDADLIAQVRAYLDFLATDFDSSARFYPVQFTDESQVEPLDMSDNFGTFDGDTELPPPPLILGANGVTSFIRGTPGLRGWNNLAQQILSVTSQFISTTPNRLVRLANSSGQLEVVSRPGGWSILELERPTNIPGLKGEFGAPSDVFEIDPAPIKISDNFGTQTSEFELQPGLRLRIKDGINAFDGAMELPPPPLILGFSPSQGILPNFGVGPGANVLGFFDPGTFILIAGNAGQGISENTVNARVNVNLQAPGITITNRIGRRLGPRDSLELERPLNIPGLTGEFGSIDDDIELKRPLNIPRIVALQIFPFDGELNMMPVGPELAGSTNDFAGVIQLQAPDVRITDDFADGYDDDFNMSGGINEPTFRFVPDYTAFQRRTSSIPLPRIANEVEGGTYQLSGLPDGLSYDAAAHAIVGTVTDAPGDYPVTMTYTE